LRAFCRLRRTAEEIPLLRTTGPYRSPPGTRLFCTHKPARHPGVPTSLNANADSDYPHIRASSSATSTIPLRCLETPEAFKSHSPEGNGGSVQHILSIMPTAERRYRPVPVWHARQDATYLVGAKPLQDFWPRWESRVEARACGGTALVRAAPTQGNSPLDIFVKHGYRAKCEHQGPRCPAVTVARSEAPA